MRSPKLASRIAVISLAVVSCHLPRNRRCTGPGGPERCRPEQHRGPPQSPSPAAACRTALLPALPGQCCHGKRPPRVPGLTDLWSGDASSAEPSMASTMGAVAGAHRGRRLWGTSTFEFPACLTRPSSRSNFNFKTKFLKISQIVERLP
jgi:hypothetical protein